MLWLLAALLLLAWGFGLMTSYTLGGLIHILLVIAVVILLLRIVGKKGKL